MAVFSAIGSVIAGNKQAKATEKAANTGLQASRENSAVIRDIYGQNKQVLSPYVESGLKPNALLAGAMGYGDQDAYKSAFGNFLKNSDYGFQLAEGSNALNSGYAGAGVLQSGDAIRESERFKQNLQAGYRGEFNNMLGNQQSLGLAAGSALAGVGTNYSNSLVANNNAGASVAANAALAGANSPFANSLGQIGGALQTGPWASSLAKGIFG